MASQQAAAAKKPSYSPPPVDGDFYKIVGVLDPNERAVLKRVREFTEGSRCANHRRLLGTG